MRDDVVALVLRDAEPAHVQVHGDTVRLASGVVPVLAERPHGRERHAQHTEIISPRDGEDLAVQVDFVGDHGERSGLPAETLRVYPTRRKLVPALMGSSE